MSEENATYNVPIKIVSECPMKRYFLITVCMDNGGFNDFTMVTDGVFPAKKDIMVVLGGSEFGTYGIINIFEFHNEADYNNFLNIV